MKNLIDYLILFTLILANTGCSLGSKSYQTAVHDLGLPVNRDDNTLVNWAVTSVDAPVWLWDDRIRYRLLYADPTHVRFYSRDRWIAPPPALLERHLSSDGKPQDYSLHIRLLDFEQQFDVPEKAWVILNFHIEAHSLDGSQSVNEREFRLKQVVATANAAGAVDSLAKLTFQAATEIQGWLEGLSANQNKQH